MGSKPQVIFEYFSGNFVITEKSLSTQTCFEFGLEEIVNPMMYH